MLPLAAALLQRRIQALDEREAQLQKVKQEQAQYGAWLVEARQQHAAEYARLQAFAASLDAQEEQFRALVLQVGGRCYVLALASLQDCCSVQSDAAAACASRTSCFLQAGYSAASCAGWGASCTVSCNV